MAEKLRSYLNKATVVKLSGLCYGTIWQMMQEDRFPHSYQLGVRSVGWDADEVQEWLATRPKTILKADRLAIVEADVEVTQPKVATSGRRRR